MTRPRDTQAGFTLIETLVALAVLAVGSVTLLVGVERHVAGMRGLSDRVAARWVAENALAATTLGVDMIPAWSNALGVDWTVRQEVLPLAGSGLSAVTARVFDPLQGPDGALVALTAYLAIGGTDQ
ncbi:type II secretion system protein [Sulfitobacter guttiformis]|uniref:Type II secretion system protein I (GspI) n=1 Tax=Sulfitobacter guttiformis TaxID=74349 RepID=A0A420DTS6_9RHOB|nr:type II secretion system protein [Sulfitobacter guttiformis]KIN71066.1 T2SI domain containing protein [Sulfitobacter guttiformis KCTC 32187]RKE97549.1 type II secretion system protein I (GspI) [Sulfitobacter guttiformis]